MKDYFSANRRRFFFSRLEFAMASARAAHTIPRLSSALETDILRCTGLPKCHIHVFTWNNQLPLVLVAPWPVRGAESRFIPALAWLALKAGHVHGTVLYAFPCR
jgi:hypothetical protein